MAPALQSEGFGVLFLARFGAPGQSPGLARIPLETFDRALDWLGRQPGVDARRLAVVGAFKGAEAALLLATRQTDLAAMVAALPSSVAWPGIDPRRSAASPHAFWTAGGRDLPVMSMAAFRPAEGIISVYRPVEDPARRAEARRAAIPVEQAQAPILLLCGEAETMWPACPMARMIAARSRAAGGPPVALLACPDAGHLMVGPPIAAGHPFHPRLAALGGSVAGNAAARVDRWLRMIAFLKEALGDG